jgi:hypothetical protein
LSIVSSRTGRKKGTYGHGKGCDEPEKGIKKLTASKAFLTSPALSTPKSNTSNLPESMTNGTTLAKMRAAIKIEARGSNPVQPNELIKMVDSMTPTDPNVSAMTCYIS